jgi:peptidoglycan/LPS O-acetylase OafA/YrhL
VRSSSGAHFIALDHVRAVAAFMVFAWHFTHGESGSPVPFEGAPAFFPFSVLDEGHTGVALFMALSGYLFAKLLDGKSVKYGAFLWNRGLRLLPLLLVVIAIAGLSRISRGESLSQYAISVAQGVVLPTLPNGGWSITVEAHYYLILPLFLWMLRRSRFLPLSLVIAAIVVRSVLHHERGEIQGLAYWTIFGRIDQFALGMLAYQFRGYLAHRPVWAAGIALAFTAFYWYFDARGGFYQSPSYPSPSPLWIFMPTIEGVAYATLLAWYDSSFTPSNKGVSKLVGLIGTYSYSIYLLHFFVVFRASYYVNKYVMDLSNFYVACAWALVFFLFMMIPGYLSYRFVESPFLKLRKRYIAGNDATRDVAPHAAPSGPAADRSSCTGGS